MSKKLEIRNARFSDALTIAKCIESAYRHYIDRIGKPPAPMLSDYTEVIENHIVFVAEINSVVGVLVLIQEEENILLDNVAVHPDHQHKGLGKTLINLAESEAVKRGFDKIQLYTHQMMIENIKMYKSLGYKETQRKNVKGYDRVYMEKQLNQ